MHKVNTRLTNNTQQEPKDIVFTETDTKWVHHSHADALVIMVEMAHSNVHKMLVDNCNAINILYWDTYKRKGLKESDLSLATSPLSGFAEDHVIPRGAIKLAVIVGKHPRVSTIVTEFLVVYYPLAFNGIIRRPLLKALKAITSIHCLMMKFPTATGIGQVRGKQWDTRECYSRLPILVEEKESHLKC